MIDVHILKHPSEERDISELEKKLEKTNLYLVQGYTNNIAKGRKEGFSKGSSRYLSFVDDDDSIESSDIFDECLEILKNDDTLDGISTLEKQVTSSGKEILQNRKYSKTNILLPNDINLLHHLVIVKRTSIEKYIDVLDKVKAFPEFTLWGTMLLDGCKFYHLPKVGYTWNNNNAARKLKLPVTDLTRDTINSCIEYKAA